MKRGRGRGGRRPSNNSPNRTLESNGPDVKVRGTAHQICEKYQALARDAHASGERVAHESYLQHAEHYHRIILASQPAPNPDANQVSNDTAPGDMEGPEETTDSNANVNANANANANANGSAEEQSDANGTEAPRGTRARRGRRTRSERNNGQSNNNGSGSEAAKTVSENSPASEASETSSDDSDAPAETA